MTHMIICKLKDRNDLTDDLKQEIQDLYKGAVAIEGIHQVRISYNCIDRENRYDLMIALDMEKSSLPLWDGSELHRLWKERYGDLLAKKAIFDAENVQFSIDRA